MEDSEGEELVRPRTLDTVQYVKDRIDQIAELLEVVDNGALKPGEVTSGPRTVFQRLPRHMRRRAMSHNVKRLPRVARELAAKYAVTAALHRHKPPSRKWRRRPTRLLKRLQRLRRHNVWLETHIWHAKRFRMADVWGWRLPLRSFQRGFRPTYREATANGGNHAAVAFDVSYLCCTQIGPQPGGAATVETTIRKLASLCATRTSPTFALSSAQRDGGEAATLLYRPDDYPRGFLGPVRFSWSIQNDSPTKWSLQIWSHPSAHAAILKSIVELLSVRLVTAELKERPNILTTPAIIMAEKEDAPMPVVKKTVAMTTKESVKPTTAGSKSAKRPAKNLKPNLSAARRQMIEKRRKDEAKRVADFAAERERIGRLPAVYESAEWRVADLRHELIRLRLVGPTAFNLLANALHLVADDDLAAVGLFGEFRESHAIWRDRFCTSGLQPGNFQDGATFSLLVEDPRLFRGHSFVPSNRQKPNEDSAPTISQVTPSTHIFWDAEFRRQQIHRRWTNARLEKTRAENSLAGLRSTPCKIPILLIVHKALPVGGLPSSLCQNQVDLMAPAETGLDFWLALQFAGGRAAGITDQIHLAFEGGALSFPADCADSAAGADYAEMDAVASRSRHLKRPHNRRLKYEGRLHVKYPFTFEWPELIADWCQSEDWSVGQRPADFFVLRDKAVLARLHVWFAAGSRSNKKKKVVGVPDREEIAQLLRQNTDALVAIRLTQTRRGRIKRLGLICLPTDEDLKRLRADPTAIVEELKPLPAGEKKEENGVDYSSDNDEEKDVLALRSDVQSARLEEFIWLDSQKTDASSSDKAFNQTLKLNDLFPDEEALALNRKREKKTKRKAAVKRRKIEAHQVIAASILEDALNERKKEDDQKTTVSTKPTTSSYRESSSRRVLGRVVRGDYSFVRSRGCAFGYCPLIVLPLLHRHKKVLLRNTSSKFYHLADVSLMAFPSAVW